VHLAPGLCSRHRAAADPLNKISHEGELGGEHGLSVPVFDHEQLRQVALRSYLHHGIA